MFWQDRRVFVTGATGLVGGYLVETLCQNQADVIALIRDHTPKAQLFQKKLHQNIFCVHGNLEDLHTLERILAEYEINTVIHLAAQTIVPIAQKSPLSTFESNIRGTWNLLEACRRVGSIQSIVVASSDKAYGDSVQLPYTEEMPLNAIYPYDVSKACADMIAASYAQTFNLPVCITRCGNFFGGGDLNWNRLIPGTIRSFIRNQAPLIRSSGHLIRDYIYVKDAVSAYMTLAKAMIENPSLSGEAFNFSNESQKNTFEIVEMIRQVMKSDLQPVILGKDDGEIKAQHLDAKKAKDLLNWTPHYSLEEGIQETITWYLSYFS